MRVMTVEVAPITDADVAAVADFLHANLNDRVPLELACSAVPWKVEAPNHGFMLRDGQRVVGTLLALYSERLVAGRVARFCNLTSWCVLPDYRSRSISLLTALLRQDGYHFTVLTPDVGPQEPDKRNPLAVAAAAAWLGVGFVMVVAVACWARGAPAWGGWSAVCSTPVIPGVCMPCGNDQ
jgi:hypothetical protein